MRKEEELGADWSMLSTFLIVNTGAAWALGLLIPILTGAASSIYDYYVDDVPIAHIRMIEDVGIVVIALLLAAGLFVYNITQIRFAKECGIPFAVRGLMHLLNLAIFPSVLLLGSLSPIIGGIVFGLAHFGIFRF